MITAQWNGFHYAVSEDTMISNRMSINYAALFVARPLLKSKVTDAAVHLGMK
jgi:hypothetical protein